MATIPRHLWQGYPREVWPDVEPLALGNAGGASGSQLWRYPSGSRWFVLRAWPPDGPAPDALQRIHGWLADASALDFLAVPVADRQGRTFRAYDGRLWEISPWRPGHPEPARPPATARVRAAMTALATFHTTLARHRSAGTSPNTVARLREVEGLLTGGFDRLERAIEASAAEPAAAAARRWIEPARAWAPRVRDELRRASGWIVPLQPCLRDARPEHILFVGDRVSGLVDYGAMGIESVASDLARLLSEWLDDDRSRRAEALDAYAAVRPLDEAETALIPVLERSSALLGAGRWARWCLVEGRAFEDPEAPRRGIERGLSRLARIVAEASGSPR
jgi:homoserine kinase type II